MGHIVLSDGDVRKRSSHSLIWIPVHNSDSVEINDIIFTGMNSQVQLKFKNGALLKIHPFSNIKLSQRFGDTEVTTRMGGIELLNTPEDNSNIHVRQGKNKMAKAYGRGAVGKLITPSGVGRQEYFEPVKMVSESDETQKKEKKKYENEDVAAVSSNDQMKTIKLNGTQTKDESNDPKQRMRRTLIVGYMGIFGIMAFIAFVINFILPRLKKNKNK